MHQIVKNIENSIVSDKYSDYVKQCDSPMIMLQKTWANNMSHDNVAKNLRQ